MAAPLMAPTLLLDANGGCPIRASPANPLKGYKMDILVLIIIIVASLYVAEKLLIACATITKAMNQVKSDIVDNPNEMDI